MIAHHMSHVCLHRLHHCSLGVLSGFVDLGPMPSAPVGGYACVHVHMYIHTHIMLVHVCVMNRMPNHDTHFENLLGKEAFSR